MNSTPLAPSAPDIWNELLALAGPEASDAAFLDKLLETWCRHHGVSEAAIYLEGPRGLDRGAAAGDLPFPQTLAESAAGQSTLRLPGGALVYRGGHGAPISAQAEPLTLLLLTTARALRLKRQLAAQRFQVNYRGVELEALYEVGLAIASTLNLEELAEVILLRAVALLDARRGALYLLEGGTYRLEQTIGGDAGGELEADDPALGAFLAGEGPAPAALLPGAAHALGVAVSIEGNLRGFLAVADKESRGGVGPFPAADRRTLGLFANQAAIALENARLHRLALERERMEREMQLAAEIQRRILPTGAPVVPGWDLVGWSLPAREVGGDYYDFVRLAEGHIAVVVGDVSGKGMPAALLVSTLHSGVRLLVDQAGAGPPLLARLNQHIFESSAPNKFITLFLAELDPAAATLTYVNAGHNPALLVKRGGEVRALGPGGLPLGLLSGASHRGETLTMAPGDLLALYTDGITEALSPADQEFTLDRLREVLRENRERPLNEIVAKIAQATEAFAAGRAQADDQTLVLLRRDP